MKKYLAALLAFALMGSQVAAAQGPEQKHIEAVKKKVAACLENSRHVSIETYDDRKLQGSISEAGPDTFVLNYHSTSTVLNYSDVRKIKWPSPANKTLQTVIIVGGVCGALLLGVVLLGGLKG
jgi:hypothetical protein